MQSLQLNYDNEQTEDSYHIQVKTCDGRNIDYFFKLFPYEIENVIGKRETLPPLFEAR